MTTALLFTRQHYDGLGINARTTGESCPCAFGDRNTLTILFGFIYGCLVFCLSVVSIKGK